MLQHSSRVPYRFKLLFDLIVLRSLLFSRVGLEIIWYCAVLHENATLWYLWLLLDVMENGAKPVNSWMNTKLHMQSDIMQLVFLIEISLTNKTISGTNQFGIESAFLIIFMHKIICLFYLSTRLYIYGFWFVMGNSMVHRQFPLSDCSNGRRTWWQWIGVAWRITVSSFIFAF